MTVCLMSALHPAEQRAGILQSCPEKYKIQLALAHDGKKLALPIGHLPLLAGPGTDEDFLQGSFIKAAFYWVAVRALGTLVVTTSPQTR